MTIIVNSIFVIAVLCGGYLFSINSHADDVELIDATIIELQTAMEDGSLTAVELVKRYLSRIEAYDQQGPRLNSIIRINPQAIKQAAALDAERQKQGARGLLHGIPSIGEACSF